MEAHQQLEINYCLKPHLNLKHLTIIIILMITQTKVNKTKTMKQTKRAILEESRAPLHCSFAPKMLQSYNNIENKFALLILSRKLASIILLRVRKNLQLFKKITTTPPRFSHSHSIFPMFDSKAQICPSACHLS